MLAFLLGRSPSDDGASDELSGVEEWRQLMVSLSLSAPVYCAGDIVRGTVEVELVGGGGVSAVFDNSDHDEEESSDGADSIDGSDREQAEA